MKLLVYKNHNDHPFGKYFQFRWKESLGYPECPYLYRWTLIFFGYTIRLHHWLRSDDNRYFHDHSCDLISIVIKGYYWNVKPIHRDSTPCIGDKCMAKNLEKCTVEFRNEKYCYVEGMFNSWKNFINFTESIWFAKAIDKHWFCIPKEGAWTILICSQSYHKWGFYVNNHKWRPLRYFHKFGIIQDKDYQ